MVALPALAPLAPLADSWPLTPDLISDLWLASRFGLRSALGWWLVLLVAESWRLTPEHPSGSSSPCLSGKMECCCFHHQRRNNDAENGNRGPGSVRFAGAGRLSGLRLRARASILLIT